MPLPDGGVIVTINDAYVPSSTAFNPVPIATLVRLDSAGTLVYSRQYGQPYGALAAIQPCRDGSYVLAGYPERAALGQACRLDGWVLRVNALTGDTINSRYFTSPGRFDDSFYDVKTAPDLTSFEFDSIRPEGTVSKVVLYAEINLRGFSNLKFDDQDELTGFVSDLTITNNNDSQKVFATVAATLCAFCNRQCYW